MSDRTKATTLLVRFFYLLIFCLIVVGIVRGCSDPADPAPLQRLTSRTAGINRMVVVAAGKYADPTFTPAEITGSGKLSELLGTLQFSSKHRFHHAPFQGEYQIQCFSNSQQLLVLTLKQPHFLHWEAPDSSEEGGILKRASQEALLACLAKNGCDILQREKASAEAAGQARLKAEQAFVSCFPPEVHDLFRPAPYGTDLPQWEAERGRKLAVSVHDPVRLVIMSSKAFGYLYDYGYTGEHEGILLAATTNLNDSDLLAGLSQIQTNRRAMLGASRLFFLNHYADKLPANESAIWTSRLIEAVLNDGREDEFPGFFEYALSRTDHSAVRDLLRRVARGETGKQTFDARNLRDWEPLPRPSAYLCLALHNDTQITLEIEKLLPQTTRALDRTALEIALALLVETNHIRMDHFANTSSFLSRSAAKAVERFPTLENLDALVFGGLSFPEHHAADMDTSTAVFEKIVKHHWTIEARYNGEIKRWWEEHRHSFQERHR